MLIKFIVKIDIIVTMENVNNQSYVHTHGTNGLFSGKVKWKNLRTVKIQRRDRSRVEKSLSKSLLLEIGHTCRRFVSLLSKNPRSLELPDTDISPRILKISYECVQSTLSVLLTF